SRRRHTRFDCDWSSDECSSDLKVTINPTVAIGNGFLNGGSLPGTPANTPATYTMQKGDRLYFEQQEELSGSAILSDKPIGVMGRSEERRVGKERGACGSSCQTR